MPTVLEAVGQTPWHVPVTQVVPTPQSAVVVQESAAAQAPPRQIWFVAHCVSKRQMGVVGVVHAPAWHARP